MKMDIQETKASTARIESMVRQYAEVATENRRTLLQQEDLLKHIIFLFGKGTQPSMSNGKGLQQLPRTEDSKI